MIPQEINRLENNRSVYDKYYDKPAWWFRLRYDTQIKRKTCFKLIHQLGYVLDYQKVLEIGFGSAATLLSFNRSCELYGIEISSSAISKAQQKAQAAGFARYEFKEAEPYNRINYPDHFFHMVIASHVLEHVEDDAFLLNEIKRVLKSGGIAIILIPINEHYPEPNHVRHYTSESFIQLARVSRMAPVFQMENELLFHLVEKPYYEGFIQKHRFWGKLIAMGFNIPTALLPFAIIRWFEKPFIWVGKKPRQAGFVLKKD